MTTWMDPKGIMLSEVRQRDKYHYDLTYMQNLNKKKTQAHRYRDQIGGWERLGVGGEQAQEVQTSSYKSGGCNVQHGNFS